MTVEEAAQRLRDRAESYSRDSMVLRADRDPAWTSYLTIAEELRKVAAELEAGTP